MRARILTAVLGLTLVTPAVAEVRYDRTLEQAVMRIMAEKIGVIRGSLPHDARMPVQPDAPQSPIRIRQLDIGTSLPGEAASHLVAPSVPPSSIIAF